MSLSSNSLGEFSCLDKGMASINSAAVVSIRRNHETRSSSSFSSISFKSCSPITNTHRQYNIAIIRKWSMIHYILF